MRPRDDPYVCIAIVLSLAILVYGLMAKKRGAVSLGGGLLGLALVVLFLVELVSEQ